MLPWAAFNIKEEDILLVMFLSLGLKKVEGTFLPGYLCGAKNWATLPQALISIGAMDPCPQGFLYYWMTQCCMSFAPCGCSLQQLAPLAHQRRKYYLVSFSIFWNTISADISLAFSRSLIKPAQSLPWKISSKFQDCCDFSMCTFLVWSSYKHSGKSAFSQAELWPPNL